MDSEGQRGTSNPSAMLTTLLMKRTKLQEDLRNIERQVHEMETSYLQDPSQCGNVLKGFEGFLSSSKSITLYMIRLWSELGGWADHCQKSLKRSRKFQPEDRLFSLSSVTSPAAEENTVGRDDNRPEYGAGRFRTGGPLTNIPGKPKKGGRTGPRGTKRIRPSSEADYDYGEDPDMIP